MRFDNQLRYALNVVETYLGEMPLHAWLKDFFRMHPQMGSTDRKQLASLVYCFYRLGHAGKQLANDERILTGLFLCSTISNPLLHYFRPEWNEQVALSLQEKYTLCGIADPLTAVFPWVTDCSDGIDPQAFTASFFTQPDLFLRLRPEHENSVKNKLTTAGIAFRECTESCIALSNATKVDQLIALNREAVVQDYSSQRVGEFFTTANHNEPPATAWDCCAASGGKSIMLHDLYPSTTLAVSDIRDSILINLKKRFTEADINKYHSFKADLSLSSFQLPVLTPEFKTPDSRLPTPHPRLPTPDSRLPTPHPDLIIADLPCTGSGTWSRTPEALYFFNEQEIERYATLQKKILRNIIPHLKKGGSLVYISCSVFKKENEEIAAFIQQEFSLRLEKMELLKGYDQRADSMFAARFIA